VVAGAVSGKDGDRVLSTRRVFEGWFNLLMLRIRSRGEEFDRALVEHPTGSAVLAYDPERRVALTVTQMRAGVLFLGHAPLAEAVGGVAEDSDYAQCARRELFEETGVRVAEVEPVGSVFMTPSSTTERVHLYLATYSPEDRIASGGGLEEEGEAVRVEERPLGELWDRVERGEMVDAKTLMLLQALRIRRPELFVAEGAA
jgi:nudix-type nucleoside diphosphatase (YffH/AdpP family)